MIITLLVAFITVAFVIGSFIYKKISEDEWCYSNLGSFFFVGKVLSSLLLAGIVLSIIICNSPWITTTERIEYQERYKIIMAAIEDKNNIVLLSSDIMDYNKDVLIGQKYNNSPWTSWLYNDIYNELPLIEFEGEG